MKLNDYQLDKVYEFWKIAYKLSKHINGSLNRPEDMKYWKYDNRPVFILTQIIESTIGYKYASAANQLLACEQTKESLKKWFDNLNGETPKNREEERCTRINRAVKKELLGI